MAIEGDDAAKKEPRDRTMEASSSGPKVFVSYSWTSPEHEQWVLELAERLSLDGVVVTLDKWDLKEGQDKHVFMEQMVHNESIAKVLVVCDLGYQTKADDRKGGVGTETQLISKEVYENTAQEKFIPIVRQFDRDGKPCIPHFMASRIYIDLSSDDRFEENYQKLIRNLYGKPLLRHPPLGTPPTYITDEDQILLKTSRKVGAIKDALLNERRSAAGLISDFLETVLSSLEDFGLEGGGVAGFDDKVATSIERMLPLRDDFIDFSFTLFRYRDSVDLDQIHDFWEKLLTLCFRPQHIQSWTEVDYDNFKFFSYELMLSFIAVLLRLKKYQEAGFFVNSQYFHRSSGSNKLRQDGIEMFNQYVRSLDELRNNRLGLKRVSVTADLIKARATRKDISFGDIRETDLVLHYVTALRGERFVWFPRTSIYGDGSEIGLFERMVSSRHFEKVKALFSVDNVDELKALIDGYVTQNSAANHGYSSVMWDYSIRPLENVIDLQKIARTS